MVDRRHIDMLPPHPAIEALRRTKYEELKGMFDENGKITINFECVHFYCFIMNFAVSKFNFSRFGTQTGRRRSCETFSNGHEFSQCES